MTPTLLKSADRTYSIDDPAAIKELFNLFGFKHYPARPDSLYSDRWTHDGPAGRTVLTLFRSGRLTLLGPPVAVLDDLGTTTIEPIGGGGAFLAFGGER